MFIKYLVCSFVYLTRQSFPAAHIHSLRLRWIRLCQPSSSIKVNIHIAQNSDTSFDLVDARDGVEPGITLPVNK